MYYKFTPIEPIIEAGHHEFLFKKDKTLAPGAVVKRPQHPDNLIFNISNHPEHGLIATMNGTVYLITETEEGQNLETGPFEYYCETTLPETPATAEGKTLVDIEGNPVIPEPAPETTTTNPVPQKYYYRFINIIDWGLNFNTNRQLAHGDTFKVPFPEGIREFIFENKGAMHGREIVNGTLSTAYYIMRRRSTVEDWEGVEATVGGAAYVTNPNTETITPAPVTPKAETPASSEAQKPQWLIDAEKKHFYKIQDQSAIPPVFYIVGKTLQPNDVFFVNDHFKEAFHVTKDGTVINIKTKKENTLRKLKDQEAAYLESGLDKQEAHEASIFGNWPEFHAMAEEYNKAPNSIEKAPQTNDQEKAEVHIMEFSISATVNIIRNQESSSSCTFYECVRGAGSDPTEALQKIEQQVKKLFTK